MFPVVVCLDACEVAERVRLGCATRQTWTRRGDGMRRGTKKQKGRGEALAVVVS